MGSHLDNYSNYSFLFPMHLQASFSSHKPTRTGCPAFSHNQPALPGGIISLCPGCCWAKSARFQVRANNEGGPLKDSFGLSSLDKSGSFISPTTSGTHKNNLIRVFSRIRAIILVSKSCLQRKPAIFIVISPPGYFRRVKLSRGSVKFLERLEP